MWEKLCKVGGIVEIIFIVLIAALQHILNKQQSSIKVNMWCNNMNIVWYQEIHDGFISWKNVNLERNLSLQEKGNFTLCITKLPKVLELCLGSLYVEWKKQPLEVFCKKNVFLKISQNLQENTLESLF